MNTNLKGKKKYFSKSDLITEVESAVANGRASERLGLILKQMVKLTRLKYFKNATDGKLGELAYDIDTDVIYRCLTQLDKFDKSRSDNVHSFLTTMIINGLRAALPANLNLVKNTINSTVRLDEIDLEDRFITGESRALKSLYS